MNKLNFKVGDRIKTTQFPWGGHHFLIKGIQNFNPNRMLYCENLRTGKFINLVEVFCSYIKPTSAFSKFSNLQIIKLTKRGNKEALKEFVRRFKKLPKFEINGRAK